MWMLRQCITCDSCGLAIWHGLAHRCTGPLVAMCADDPIASHEQIEDAWKRPQEIVARLPESHAREQTRQYLDLAEQWAHAAREAVKPEAAPS